MAGPGKCRAARQGTTPEEDADETREVTEHLTDACQQVPEVLEEVDDGIHSHLIAEESSDGNLP
jgi:hypothetical protein